MGEALIIPGTSLNEGSCPYNKELPFHTACPSWRGKETGNTAALCSLLTGECGKGQRTACKALAPWERWHPPPGNVMVGKSDIHHRLSLWGWLSLQPSQDREGSQQLVQRRVSLGNAPLPLQSHLPLIPQSPRLPLVPLTYTKLGV